ncbi:MAG: molybdenum cofactor biosynthesis protein [Myxococcales bacterium]|nr:molybdenum cofactor biosynthesis protein [Myxococcales bacterium]
MSEATASARPQCRRRGSARRSASRRRAKRATPRVYCAPRRTDQEVAMSTRAFVPVGCAVVTVSDTRTFETDKSGAVIVDRLTAMGHPIIDRRIVRDEQSVITELVAEYVDRDDVTVVVLTGGTGLTRRDVTPDAIAALGTKHIPGFGELFRWLSYADIGSSTIQSRADAWLCGTTLVFALPGSTGAVTLAMDRILVEQLDARHRPCNFIELLPRILG